MSRTIAGRAPEPGLKTRLNPCKMAGNWARNEGVEALSSTGAAAQLSDRLGAERRVQARDQLLSHQVELLRPHRGRTGHRQNTVALGRRARRLRYRRAGRGLPYLLHVGERARRGEGPREPLQGYRQGTWGRSAHAASASVRMRPAETRSRVTDASAAPGTWAMSVV